jgi:citrate synthase
VTLSTYDAAEAAARLKVSRTTVYAYVSRGLIRAVADPEDPRRSRYRAADVDQLARQKSRGRKPDRIAATTLDWGLPVLASRITLIGSGHLYYRGRDAIALADTATFEETARRLWDCGASDPFGAAGSPLPRHAEAGDGPIERCLAALVRFDAAASGSRAPGIWQREPSRLWPVAASLLRTVAAAAGGSTPTVAPIHLQLAAAWGCDATSADRLRRALILCADHELNASTFAVRVVASTGASLAACAIAGLAALSGPRHGGATARVEALFDEIERAGDARRVVAERYARGELVPGFAHPLYPDGDPRCPALLSALPADATRDALIAELDRVGGKPPNIDLALVALRRALALPRGAALALFAVGRCAGWVAHALEQQGEGALIRPRARYVGERPPAATDERGI